MATTNYGAETGLSFCKTNKQTKTPLSRAFMPHLRVDLARLRFIISRVLSFVFAFSLFILCACLSLLKQISGSHAYFVFFVVVTP